MVINQDWSVEWTTFFDEHAGSFHSSFKRKLAKQLFEKGSSETGIQGFDKYDFQILVGQEELEMRQIENNMFALVSFITPPAYSEPVWIYWTAEDADVSTLHTQDVSAINIQFHWGGSFPREKILPYLTPYKREKKDKTGLHFDVEYYHNAFPDISFELVFAKPPAKKQIEAINIAIVHFVNEWNNQNKGKFINYAGSLKQKNNNTYEAAADMGLGNTIKTVGILLKTLSEQIPPNEISHIMVK